MPAVPTSSAAYNSSVLVKAAHLKAKERRMLLNDIRTTWGKFDDDELAALKNPDDLVSQLVLKYGIEEAQARRDVDNLVDGRSF
jgi:hypothetical protein